MPNPEPFAVLLGRGPLRAAGAPEIETLAQRVVGTLAGSSAEANVGMHRVAAADETARSTELVKSFYSLLANWPDVERRTVLKNLYSDVAVPTSYLNLARLIKAGFVSRVVNANIDPQLEQALTLAGMWEFSDFRIVSIGVQPDPLTDVLPGSAEPAIVIAKIFDTDAAKAPGTVAENLASAFHFPSSPAGALVVLGYNFESQAANQWLTGQRPSSGWTPSRIWWVNPVAPVPKWIDALNASHGAGDIIFITDRDSEPDLFMSRLTYVLTQSSWEPTSKVAEETNESARNIGQAEPAASQKRSDVELEYVQDRLRRIQTQIYAFEARALTNDTGLGVDSQVGYLEQQLASVQKDLEHLKVGRAESAQVTGLRERAQALLGYLRRIGGKGEA